jgi:hypothetical protein
MSLAIRVTLRRVYADCVTIILLVIIVSSALVIRTVLPLDYAPFVRNNAWTTLPNIAMASNFALLLVTVYPREITVLGFALPQLLSPCFPST